MDAAKLAFSDARFDNVTFFYSMMYMDGETQRKAVSEAYRVLKAGGRLVIWDAVIETASPEPFLLDLSIDVAGETVRTTYGVLRENARLNAEILTARCRDCGFLPLAAEQNLHTYRLMFQKG